MLNPVFLTIAGGLAAALCAVGLENTWDSGNVRASIAWAAGVAASIAISAVPTWRNKLDQSKAAARHCIRKALMACAASYGHPSLHVRANVMLTHGARRRVDSQTAFNMQHDPDYDLEIDATAGVSGEAYSQRCTTYGDLALALQPGGPTWGLKPGEKAKVRPTLKSILSVPVFDPDNPEGKLLGTLQVDSDHTFTEMQFDNPERRAVAERFADVIALLSKAGRYDARAENAASAAAADQVGGSEAWNLPVDKFVQHLHYQEVALGALCA